MLKLPLPEIFHTFSVELFSETILIFIFRTVEGIHAKRSRNSFCPRLNELTCQLSELEDLRDRVEEAE